MNVLQSFLGLFKKEQAVNKPAAYMSFTDSYHYLQSNGSEEYLKSYNSWVYAAVTKRADTFASMKLTLNKIVKKSGENTVEPVKSHPVLELLDKVNPYLSFPDLLKITQTYKDLTGNAYWWLIMAGSKVVEIWPYFRPDRMSVVPSATEFIAGYEYQTPTGDIVKFNTDEIIHFKYPNPLDPYLGVSPMSACYLAYNTYIKSAEYNNRFFNNNARADFILSFPNGITETEQKQLSTQWNARHQGRGHEHRPGILSGDAKILTTGMSAKDMEFIEQQKSTRDEILAIFKVPKALLDPQELNFASAQVAKEVFAEEVVIPMMNDLVCTLNEFLLPHYGDDSLFFDFEDPAEENAETKYTRYDVLSRVGAISPNEIRAGEGLPPFEGGDAVYMSAMVAPIGEASGEQGKMFLGRTKNVEIPKKYHVNIKSKSESADLRADIEDALRKDMKPVTIAKKEKILPEKKKSEKQMFRESVWYSKIAKTNKDESDMRRMLNKQFTRQEKDVLKSLKEKSFSFDFDVDEEEGIFVEMFNPYMSGIVKAYGADAMDMVSSDNFSMSARAKDWIKKNVKNFSGEINKVTQDKIRKALEVSVEEGEGIEQAQRRIRTVFKEATTSRARAIARTEIQHSSNFASVEAWKQSEVVSGKEWLTSFDENTCEECGGLDGKTVSLDSEFDVTDDLFADAEEPPAHVNCRCTLIPVIKTKNIVIEDIKAKEVEASKNIAESKKLLMETREALEDTKQVIKNINEVITDEQEDK